MPRRSILSSQAENGTRIAARNIIIFKILIRVFPNLSICPKLYKYTHTFFVKLIYSCISQKFREIKSHLMEIIEPKDFIKIKMKIRVMEAKKTTIIKKNLKRPFQDLEDQEIIINEKYFQKNLPPSKKPRMEFKSSLEDLVNEENEAKNRSPPSKQPCKAKESKSYLEDFLNIPGLQHLAENIFSSLSYDDLKSCRRINRSSKHILDNPIFWLKKFIRRGLSKKHQTDWHNVIQVTRNTKLEKNILLYLKRSSKHEKLVELPCYIDEKVVKKSFKISKETDVRNILNWYELEAGYIQIFAPLSRNLNSVVHFGVDEVKDGDIKFIKSLAPLTENPNKPGQKIKKKVQAEKKS